MLEITSVMWFASAVALIMLLVGLIYATGIEDGHRRAGLALIVLGAASLVSCWRLAVVARRMDDSAAGSRNDASS